MQARLLSLLLLHANRVVPFRAAISELWDWPPKLARKTIQTYVYQLRAALGPINEVTGRQLIETHAGGYCLRLADHQIDLWQFNQLVEEGRCARDIGEHLRAAAVLREALALWRGLPLGNLEFGPGLSAQLSLLEEQRLAALEDRVGADLRLGRFRELTAELKGLVVQYPLHEGFCAQLMETARRSGNPAMALDAFRNLRRNLVNQLGLEPSQPLQKLQADILNAAPVEAEAPARSGIQPPLSPGQLPAGIADFTGRSVQLAMIKSILGAPNPTTRSTKVIVVVGKPGIGKSTLAVHVAHLLKEQFPDGQLFVTLRESDGWSVDGPEVTSYLLSSLGHPRAEQPANADERSALLRTLTANRRLLMILDDADSAEQVAPLIPGGPDSVVIITSQRRLVGLSASCTIELGPMEQPECEELLTRMVGHSRVAGQEAAVADVAELCDRLPLAVRIAGEKLISRRAWTIGKLADRLADEPRRHAELTVGGLDLRARLDLAARRLPAWCQTVLVELCRLGPGWFDLATAARAVGVAPLEAEEPIGALVDCHLLDVQAFSPGAFFRFSDLVRLHFAHPRDGIRELTPALGGPAMGCAVAR